MPFVQQPQAQYHPERDCGLQAQARPTREIAIAHQATKQESQKAATRSFCVLDPWRIAIGSVTHATAAGT